jgi:hypothetical protein
MDKKFYMMPEVEVIDLELQNAIMVISVGDDEDPGIIPGEGDTGDLG